MTQLYLDLDGVLADFDRHFREKFNKQPGDVPDAELWKLINSDSDFFLSMPPTPGAINFFWDVTSDENIPIILTACPKTNYPHVARQKRQWVQEWLTPKATVIPMLGSIHKPLFMHAQGDILVDDRRDVCDAWKQAGGIAIHHEGNLETTAKALSFFYEEA